MYDFQTRRGKIKQENDINSKKERKYMINFLKRLKEREIDKYIIITDTLF